MLPLPVGAWGIQSRHQWGPSPCGGAGGAYLYLLKGDLKRKRFIVVGIQRALFDGRFLLLQSLGSLVESYFHIGICFGHKIHITVNCFTCYRAGMLWSHFQKVFATCEFELKLYLEKFRIVKGNVCNTFWCTWQHQHLARVGTSCNEICIYEK